MVCIFPRSKLSFTIENLSSNFDTQRINERQNKVVITDRMWARLLSSTNQPSFLSPKDLEEAKKAEQPPTELLEGNNCNDVGDAGKEEQPPKDEQESGNHADNGIKTEN